MHLIFKFKGLEKKFRPMKKFYTLLTLTFITLLAAGQRSNIVLGYLYSTPQAAMKDGWNQAHGLQMAYLWDVGESRKFSLGPQLGFGSYANNTSEQHYSFQGAPPTITTASLHSALSNFGLTGRYHPLGQAQKRISPFAEVQSGYQNMRSSISFPDPTDMSDCPAHEQTNVVSNGTMYGSLGGGIQIAFGKAKGNARNHLELSARSVFGGQIEYANMNRLYNHPNLTSPTVRGQSANERPLLLNFVNIGTNELHEHTVAELYNHPLRMWQFNINWVIKLRNNN
jgi:hypothetical protein